jgi:aquaporin Z
MTRKLLTEVIGTFFLVLTIGLTVTAGSSMAPLAIGAALMGLVYMGGAVSGAHYNPAVTLAVLLRRKIAAGEAAAYMVVQIAGATLAALAVYAIAGQTFVPAPGAGVSMGTALLVEVLFTFALALVVLNVATTAAGEGNSYFGLAIGLTVTAGAFAGGAISGGAFNPAVGLGPAIVTALLGTAPVSHVWLYVVGPLLGGAVAAVVFRVQNPVEFGPVVTPYLAGIRQPEDAATPVGPRA